MKTDIARVIHYYSQKPSDEKNLHGFIWVELLHVNAEYEVGELKFLLGFLLKFCLFEPLSDISLATRTTTFVPNTLP